MIRRFYYRQRSKTIPIILHHPLQNHFAPLAYTQDPLKILKLIGSKEGSRRNAKFCMPSY
jgi:hypothetical protein